MDKVGHDTLQVISKAIHFNQWMYEQIKDDVHGEILEIGSGIGNISHFFIEAGSTITLSDFDINYHSILKEKFGNKKNVRGILQIDLQHPQFKEAYKMLEGAFDSVFLLNVLEHLKDEKAAVNNCSFLLKQNGTLVILVPAYSFLFSSLDKELGHYRRYTKKKLEMVLIKKSFAIKKGFYFNALGIAAWLYGKVFAIKKIPGNEMSIFNSLTKVGKWIDKMLFKKVGLSVIIIATKTKEAL